MKLMKFFQALKNENNMIKHFELGGEYE